jgi:hypothetical protein
MGISYNYRLKRARKAKGFLGWGVGRNFLNSPGGEFKL